MFPSISKRFVLLPVLAAVTVLVMSAIPGGHVYADTGFIDISGKPIQLQTVKQDPLSGKTTDEPSPIASLPAAAQQLLNTPLSTQLDQLWSGTVSAAVCNQITSNLQGQGSGGFHTYDVTCSLAKTGKLSASQQGDKVILSYYLPSNVIETYITTPATCAPDHGTIFCPTDPKISLTLDVELQAAIVAPGSACDLHADQNATALFHNANIDSQNLTADIAKDAASLFASVTGTDFVAMGENDINQAVLPQQLPFASQIASMSSALCSGLLAKSGDSWSLNASVDPAQGIIFQLVDMPPVPSFFHPMLSAEQPIVTAGNSLKLDGQYFPSSAATLVTLSMDGSAQPSQASAASPQIDSTHILVDQIPMIASESSGLSTRLSSTSAASHLLSAHVTLGTATITSQGTFSATVTIPAGTTAGSHTIHAAAGTAEADATIQVTAPSSSGGSATMVLVAVLPGETGCPPHIVTSTETDSTFLLSGNGFLPGSVRIALDSSTGTVLGTATADTNGNFCVTLQGVPRSQAGPHKLVAVEGGDVKAQLAVTFVIPEVIH